MVFRCVSHYSLWEDSEEGGGDQTSLAHSSCGLEPFSYVVVMVDCAGRLVVEAFCGSDQVVIDVIQSHGCPQSCLPNSVERLLKVHNDMVKALWCCMYFSQSMLRLCSLLLWSLPVLLWWSPQLVTSVYSRRFLAWPYLDDWSGWWYGNFGIVVVCLSFREWWSGTESKVLATLLCARSYCRWFVT